MRSLLRLTCLLTALFSPPALAANRPPSGSVVMGSVVVDNSNLPSKPQGPVPTGPLTWDQIHLDTKICRQNTAGSVIALDNSFMTVIFDDVKTNIGGGSFKYKSTGSICSVGLKMEAPSGWRLRIDSADYRGYYNLQKGVTGTINAVYEFKGENRQYLMKKTIKGPVTTDFLFHEPGELTVKGSAPCGQRNVSMVITIEVALETDDPDAIGSIWADSADAHFSQLVNLNWEKC